MSSALAAVHDALGARWDESGAARVPRNYGDAAAEYAAARAGVVLIDRPDRSLLRVYGRDPGRMVQGLVSNDVTRASHDRAVYAAVLTPKGKMVADVRIVRRGDELLLETDAAAAGPLTAHLRKFVPPLFARFEDAAAHWHVLTVLGPQAAPLLGAALGGAALDDATTDALHEAELDGEPVLAVTTSHADVSGFDVLCAPAAAVALWRRLVDAGARPAGHATLDVLRIEAGTPKWGAELDEGTIPLEAGLRERAISETKGCYTGQEVIIRILHRGHVNWLLRGVLLGDRPAPARGAALLNEAGKKAGRITSAAWSPRHGQTVALAYVRREVEPGTTLSLEDPGANDARVVALPFA
jgi:tRNA-modifying protein YgfZ